MKAPVKSRTLWVAGVTGILAGVNYLAGVIEDAQTLSLIVLGQAVVAAVLRWLTVEPVK